MKLLIDKLCDGIRALGKDFETEPSNGNPITAECNQAKADVCIQIAEVIRLELTGKEK